PVRRNQEPGEARDWIGVGPGSIGDGYTEVVGHRLYRSCGSSGGFEACFNKFSRCVLHGTESNVVLQGVDQFDVSESTFHLPNLARHAFVALAAKSHRPADGGSRTHLRFPLGADLREVVGKDISGAASVRTMDHHDWQAGKFDARVCFGNRWVAPIRDLAEKYSCQYLRRELNAACNTRNVIGRDHGPEHCRNMEDFELGFGKLLVCHWPVARAKIHGSRHELANSRAAANALVVDLNVGMGVVIFTEPLLIDRVREGRARGIQIFGNGRSNHQHNGAHQQQKASDHSFSSLWNQLIFMEKWLRDC